MKILTAMKEIDGNIVEYFVKRDFGNKICFRNVGKEVKEIVEVKFVIGDLINLLTNYIMESRTLSFDFKKKILFEYCKLYGGTPKRFNEYNMIKIGSLYHNQKTQIKCENYEIYVDLSKNKIVKDDLDKFLDKKKLSWNEYKNLLFKYCILKDKIPSRYVEYGGYPLGMWFKHQKNELTNINCERYLNLSENKVVKNELDRFLANKNKIKKDRTKVNWEEYKVLLFIYCDLNNQIPKNEIEFKGAKIGIWYRNQKYKINNINHQIYQKLSENSILKINLDSFLEFKNKNQNTTRASWDLCRKILFEYCERYNEIPEISVKYENINLGMWFRRQKYKIKSEDDKIYISLSQNDLIKESFNKFLKRKSLKRLTDRDNLSNSPKHD